MLNCYCQLSSSVIFRLNMVYIYVSQSECKIDRPRPGLPRLSPCPHTEALGTRLWLGKTSHGFNTVTILGLINDINNRNHRMFIKSIFLYLQNYCSIAYCSCVRGLP